MKKMRKGFTLIELLIVVAIMAALSAMMAASSADSIDSAQASAILNNLQSMKTAAYEMYMNEPAVASLAELNGSTKVTNSSTGNTVQAVLGRYLGRVDIATNYGIVGDTDAWYVYYSLQDNDSAKVKTILQNKANNAGLLGLSAAISGTAKTDIGKLKATTVTYYKTTDKVAVIRVR